jgi:ATP-dependent protease ClpP protease subunit
MKKLLISSSFAIAMLTGAAHADRASISAAIPRHDPALVTVDGDTINFRGAISKASHAVLVEAVARAEPGSLKHLVVSSGGGDTDYGIKIGEIVFSNKLTVEVDTICFSSCANYIFPAGTTRTIRKDAFVGWHGNARGFAEDAKDQGITLNAYLDAKMRRDLKDAVTADGMLKDDDGKMVSLESVIADLQIETPVKMAVEAEYYKLLGLNDRFAVCFVGDRLGKLPDTIIGWGFSIEDMNKLGMGNTTYMGEGEYHRDSAGFGAFLQLVRASDCN